MKYILIASTIILILTVILICTVIYYRRKISSFSEELICILDDMTAENSPDFKITEDTVDGKINIRLKRL